MKVKQRTVCQECRTRKLGCDGKAPACTQCRLRGRDCPGYQDDFIFRPHNKLQSAPLFNKSSRQDTARLAASRTAKRNQSRHDSLVLLSADCRCAGVLWAEPFNPVQLELARSEEIISLIAKHYIPEEELCLASPTVYSSQSRICGCWVAVLPAIVTSRQKRDVVSSAIESLGLSILNRDSRKRGLNSDLTEGYCAALAILRNGFSASNTSEYVGLTAASMCLALTEVLFPTCDDGWRSHVQGVGHLMQLPGPNLHSSGTPFKLFVGFRPLLVIEAFIARKATFVALEEWINIPFQFNPASPMQSLLSHAAAIPSLLENSDLLEQFPANATQSTVAETCAGFEQVFCALLQWEKAQSNQENGIPYWTTSTRNTTGFGPGPSGMPHVSLWFPNILLANAFTHLWTFQVICIIESEKFISRLSNGAYERVLMNSELPCTIFNRESIFQLSIKICQSMKYQLQDEMKLYGPASILFPLRIAREIFEMDAIQHCEQIIWCQGFSDQLRSKGIYLPP